MNIVAIRGATNIYNNTREDIIKDTKELLEKIIIENNLVIENIISILFTATKDITKAYPAIAARELNIVDAGLMCLNEMLVEDSMENCLRTMIYYQGDINRKEINHIYLKDTKALRPDLVRKGALLSD